MPPGVRSQTPGGALLGSQDSTSNHVKPMPQLIGQCPVVQVSMGGQMVPYLLDTSSMV